MPIPMKRPILDKPYVPVAILPVQSPKTIRAVFSPLACEILVFFIVGVRAPPMRQPTFHLAFVDCHCIVELYYKTRLGVSAGP